MISYKHTYLPIACLPNATTKSFICNSLTRYGLLSIPQLTAHGCIDTFSTSSMTMKFHSQLIFTSNKHLPSNLFIISHKYLFPISLQQQYANHMSPIPPNLDRHCLLQFYHKEFFSPCKSTLLKSSLSNHLISFPGLTPQNILTHITNSTSTQSGHMKHTPDNFRSTHPPSPLTSSSTQQKFHGKKSKILNELKMFGDMGIVKTVYEKKSLAK